MEIDGAGERDSAANRLMDIANGSGREHLYCKHDGSLDDGIELVTHPMTLTYHMDEMPWARVLSETAGWATPATRPVPAGFTATSIGTPLARQKRSRRT